MGTFLSYSQNLEDVMLWRALREQEAGFYIDVGAAEPVTDSVTKAFYEAGWSGINIEPVESSFRALREDRPRDVNLNVAVGAGTGSQELFLVGGGNGLSTMVDEYAQKHETEGWEIARTIVQQQTLAEICETHVTGDIHFLKVDVEGAEGSVLEGADFTRWRPWIVLVEATEPNTTVPTHDAWEPILVKAGYTFTYFDGLNRFYLAEEKLAELGVHFKAPPNVLDYFEQFKHHAAHGEVAYLKEVNAGLNAELDGAQQELFESSRWLGVLSRDVHNARLALGNAEKEVAALRSELKASAREVARQKKAAAALKRRNLEIRRSTSWRITWPMRVVGRRVARLRRK